MKNKLLIAALACGALAANAQTGVEPTSLADNWSIGVTGGVTTPLNGGRMVGKHSFFGSMRGTFGFDIHKQISYYFGLGAEGYWSVNTSSWYSPVSSANSIDGQYLGVYGTFSLSRLFSGFRCGGSRFGVDVVLGAGWGHDFWPKAQGQDWNYFATKTGLNLDYNVNNSLTLSLRPSIIWDMSDAGTQQSSAAYNSNCAAFNLSVAVMYHFGARTHCVTCPPDQSTEVAALNDRVNELRGELAQANNAAVAAQGRANQLSQELAACQSRAPQIVQEVTNNLESVRYVYFGLGKHNITADQMPNVEMIANYMKNHPESTVVIKGYASQDGNLDFNIKLAKNRAESVKNALINKYKISPKRITAEGEGIGHMFKEESWNRVAICILDAE